MSLEGVKRIIEWTKIKIRIHVSEKVFYFHEGEIWWASIGANVGHEQDGKNQNFERPILVLKKFNRYLLWALPLTSQIKDNNAYYYKYQLNSRIYSVVLSQLRMISSKRLLRRIGRFPAVDFEKVRQEIKSLI